MGWIAILIHPVEFLFFSFSKMQITLDKIICPFLFFLKKNKIINDRGPKSPTKWRVLDECHSPIGGNMGPTHELMVHLTKCVITTTINRACSERGSSRIPLGRFVLVSLRIFKIMFNNSYSYHLII